MERESVGIDPSGRTPDHLRGFSKDCIQETLPLSDSFEHRSRDITRFTSGSTLLNPPSLLIQNGCCQHWVREPIDGVLPVVSLTNTN